MLVPGREGVSICSDCVEFSARTLRSGTRRAGYQGPVLMTAAHREWLDSFLGQIKRVELVASELMQGASDPRVPLSLRASVRETVDQLAESVGQALSAVAQIPTELASPCGSCFGTGRVLCPDCRGQGARAESAGIPEDPTSQSVFSSLDASGVESYRVVELPEGKAVVEEVARAPESRHAIELLMMPDGQLALRFLSYGISSDLPEPLLINEDTLAALGEAMAGTRIQTLLLRLAHAKQREQF